MRRFLVISDSHGNETGILKALESAGQVDAVIHLGDFERDVRCLSGKAKVYSVRGNCDMGSVQREERLVSFGGRRILMVHGHRQRVKQGLLGLGFYAQEKQADAVLFGHTHIATQQYSAGVLLYNPGSLSGMIQTYGILKIDENGLISAETHILQLPG